MSVLPVSVRLSLWATAAYAGRLSVEEAVTWAHPDLDHLAGDLGHLALWRGLGERFTEEVEAALKLASLFPEIGSPYKYGTRRVFPKKFPFSIVYTVLVKELVVLAIAPFPRKVAYWRNRKSAG